jgi:hypothetical protein
MGDRITRFPHKPPFFPARHYLMHDRYIGKEADRIMSDSIAPVSDLIDGARWCCRSCGIPSSNRLASGAKEDQTGCRQPGCTSLAGWQSVENMDVGLGYCLERLWNQEIGKGYG